MRRVGLLLACGIGLVVCASGQGVVPTANASAAYVPTMTFDVATIRESKPDPQGFSISGGFTPANSSHLLVQNWDLENLIKSVYPVRGRLEGMDKLPEAVRGARFNVEAKGDAETDERLARLDQKDRELEQHHMLQVLLAERLNLKVHWETHQGEVYNLVVSKPGRLRGTGVPPTAEEAAIFGDRGVPLIYQNGSTTGGFEYIAHGATTDDLADTLGAQFGRPVIDKTGLTGKYDFHMKAYGIFSSERKLDETNPLPALDTAIQDDLGLKIVPARGPIPVLVVDHVEMPSAN